MAGTEGHSQSGLYPELLGVLLTRRLEQNNMEN